MPWVRYRLQLLVTRRSALYWADTSVFLYTFRHSRLMLASSVVLLCGYPVVWLKLTADRGSYYCSPCYRYTVSRGIEFCYAYQIARCPKNVALEPFPLQTTKIPVLEVGILTHVVLFQQLPESTRIFWPADRICSRFSAPENFRDRAGNWCYAASLETHAASTVATVFCFVLSKFCC